MMINLMTMTNMALAMAMMKLMMMMMMMMEYGTLGQVGFSYTQEMESATFEAAQIRS